jgi:hypothetical protein
VGDFAEPKRQGARPGGKNEGDSGDAGAATGPAQLAARFLVGKAGLSDGVVVGLHQALIDPQLVARVIAASKRGALLGAGLGTPGRSLRHMIADPRFDWGQSSGADGAAGDAGAAAAGDAGADAAAGDAGTAAVADHGVGVAIPRGGGAPLPSALRTKVEHATGTELGDARAHTGADSAAAAADLGARAFTVGPDIHFGAGQYDPSSPAGEHLIAHELAHTVQQRGAAAPTVQAKLEVSRPGDAHEQAADRFADAAVAGGEAPTALAAPSLTRAAIQRDAVGATPPIETKVKRHSAAEMKEMTLNDLKKYSDEQIDWANNPALKDRDRQLVWRWVMFARASDGNLAGCGKMKVASLEKHADSADKRDALSAYGDAISGGRATAGIQTPAKSVQEMIKWGRYLGKLEESMGGPTLKRIITDDAWQTLVDNPKLIDYTIDFTNTCDPVLDAESGHEIFSIDAMHDEKAPYKTYKGELPEIRNYHRFHDKGLKQVAKNKKDKSKKKPLTLVLQAANDHNGFLHRNEGMRDVLADTRNLTLVIEGAETLAAVQSQVSDLADQYGKPGADGKGKIDQVMIAGHGGATSLELAGKMEMGPNGTMEEKRHDLEVGDKESNALLDEILAHMDPSSPHHKTVFNACLTASNSVDSSDLNDAVKAGKDPAQAVKESIKAKPSFATAMAERAKALGFVDPKTGESSIQTVGANSSIFPVQLQDPKSGALALVNKEDPAVTGTKLEYVRKGAEPLGVMRAVVESWADNKAATLEAMEKRVKSKLVIDWRSHLVHQIFTIILAHYKDDIAVINEFTEWAGNLGELERARVRVWAFTPPKAIEKHMTEVTKYVLKHEGFSGSDYYPLVVHETELILGLTPAEKLLADLGKFSCQSAQEFIDRGLMTKSKELLGALDSKHLHGQLVVALLDVIAHDTPNADAKAFLLAHGVDGDKLTKKASTALAGKMSEEKLLLRLGIGAKASAGAPKANADTDGDKKNDIYVEPLSLSGEITSPYGDVDVRSAPAASAGAIGKLSDGVGVVIVGKVDKWYAIQHDLKLAYIEQAQVMLKKEDNLVPFASPGVVSSPYGADVRAKPDETSPLLVELPMGEAVQIVGRTKDWFAIHHQHRTAWVSRLTVDAKKLKVERKAGKGKALWAAPLWNTLGDDAQQQGALVKGETVDILGRVEPEVPYMGGHAYFGIKRSGDEIFYVNVDSLEVQK